MVMNATGRLQRFKAAIQKTGVNFFVEVPARVSSSMRSFAHSGRIRVAGQLNQTPMQGTLIPVAGGRHRLFVNGGTRSAAKVGLGDVVSIELSPTTPNEVVAPEDLAAGLHRVPGALDAFNVQPVARRRELILYPNAHIHVLRIRRPEELDLEVVGWIKEAYAVGCQQHLLRSG